MKIRLQLSAAVLFFAVCLSPVALGDSVPPSFTWISPANHSVLTTSLIRLAVDAHDSGSGIASVRFFVEYHDNNNRHQPRHFVGHIDSYPYEFLWDCAHIPDQSIGRIRFFAEVSDRAGNVETFAGEDANQDGPLIVLDRNPIRNNEMQLISHFSKASFIIDGLLNEWAPQDSVLFFHNDNRIVAYSRWSREMLYVAVVATGRSIISHYPPDVESIDGIENEDVMALSFDTNHDHFEIPTATDRRFIIAAAGKTVEILSHIDDRLYESSLNSAPPVISAVKQYGTLNDGSDADVGYTIEFAISWKELGVSPGNDTTIGFDIWNSDMDYINGTSSFAAWSTTSSGRNNPSEWGNLRLVGNDNRVRNAFLGVVLFVVAAGTVFIFLRRQKGTAKQEELEPDILEKDYIIKAREYVLEHLSDESLSRDEVAAAVGLTSSYFGKLFKHEAGLSFSEYIAELRIVKAKDLLVSTQKNISEIALEVGFSTQSYFGYCFKKNENKSPSEFRAENR